MWVFPSLLSFPFFTLNMLSPYFSHVWLLLHVLQIDLSIQFLHQLRSLSIICEHTSRCLCKIKVRVVVYLLAFGILTCRNTLKKSFV